MKKKIIFAITKGNWGGAQRYVFDLATHLPAEQFDITVICGAGEQLAEKLKEKNIRVIHLDFLNRNIDPVNDWRSFATLYNFFRTEKPDIIHLNSSKIGGLGALAGRLAGIPKIIFTGHGWAWNEKRSFVSKTIITALHWLTITLSHTTIAVSEKIESEILRLPFVQKSKTIVIYNGVSDIEYLERFAARAALKGTITEKFWIGTISELHKNKGLDNLIGAFSEISKSHPDIALVIIGEGEERGALNKQIDKLGLAKKVHLLGFKDAAPRFLKALDVFVLASRTEAFPYAPLEAGLAQLPVIATRVGGVPEIISSGKNGLLVNSGDVPALADAIKELLTDGVKAAMFGHNLRKDVEEKFSLNGMVRRTISIYN